MSKAINIDFKCSIKQALVCQYWIDNETLDIVYGGSKASGKSYLGCSILAANALMYPDTRYFIARAELIDLRGSTSVTMRKVLDSWGLKEDVHFSYNGQDNYWKFYNGSVIKYLQAKREPQDPLYARFGSMEFTQGWIEEAGDRIEHDAKNNLIATLGRHNNDKYGIKIKLLQTCNPSKNYLYSEYYQLNKQGKLPAFKKFIQAFPDDNPFQPKGYLDNLHKNLSYNEKQRLLFGNWEYDDDPTVLCDFEAITDLFTNDHVIGNGMNKRLSADLAMQGRDTFVVAEDDNGVINFLLDRPKATGKSIETDIKNLSIERKIGRSNIVADSDGMGAYLESYLNGIKSFHGNGTAFDKEFNNIKSECAFKLAEKINKRELKILCSEEQKQRIMDELGVLKQVSVSDDEKKKRIISKDDMKKQILRSPDYLDVLIMLMYYYVIPKKASTFVIR